VGKSPSEVYEHQFQPNRNPHRATENKTELQNHPHSKQSDENQLPEESSGELGKQPNLTFTRLTALA
jgi:hypothetical protein